MAGNIATSNDEIFRINVLEFSIVGSALILKPKSHQMTSNLAMILEAAKSVFSAYELYN